MSEIKIMHNKFTFAILLIVQVLSEWYRLNLRGTNERRPLCFTVQWHEYTCSGIITTLSVKIQHKDNIICGALCQNVAGL